MDTTQNEYDKAMNADPRVQEEEPVDELVAGKVPQSDMEDIIKARRALRGAFENTRRAR